MKTPQGTIVLVGLVGSVLVTWSAACGSARPGTGLDGSSGGTGGLGGVGGSNGSNGSTAGGGMSFVGSLGDGTGGSPPACSGLGCQIHSCPGGGATAVTGTIYDPAGKNPLYGIVAYVPNSTPAPIVSGASCYTCADLYTGDPLASAVTDANGNFTLTNVPDGANIPLVIQVGKWRRQLTLPSVTMCATTAVPDGTLTLPKNAGEGDMPSVAISTGSADTLECLLTRVGVDEAEYLPGAGASGHIHIFKGNPGAPDTEPGAPDPSTSLWDSSTDIMQYDIVLLSCEGRETLNMNQQVLFDYAAAGGRVFASHFHYAWFDTGPFGAANLATWAPGSNQIGSGLAASIVTTTWANQPFPRGQALHDWLANVGALVNDELPIDAPRHNADVSATNTPSQPWIVADNGSQAPGAAQDFSFDTPLGAPAAQQCGRVVFSDMHVGAASNDYSGGYGKIAPIGCADQDLSPQEKALEFILFDLSSCVTANNAPQPPPATQTQ